MDICNCRQLLCASVASRKVLTQPDPTRPDPTQPDPTRPNPTQPNPTQPNPTRPDPTQPNPTQKKMLCCHWASVRARPRKRFSSISLGDPVARWDAQHARQKRARDARKEPLLTLGVVEIKQGFARDGSHFRWAGSGWGQFRATRPDWEDLNGAVGNEQGISRDASHLRGSGRGQAMATRPER